MPSVTLNEQAAWLADQMAAAARPLRLAVSQSSAGARLIDCGISALGGVQAGLGMARVATAGLAEIALSAGEVAGMACPMLQVVTDQPIAACLACQYAGWQISAGKYFAMGSGPMRVAYGKEELFDHIPGREKSPVAVGVLETRKLPDDAAIAFLSERLGLAPDKITLLAAPTTSLTGTIQVVARSLETALHKLHVLKFDVAQVVSGFGVAPLPPVATSDLEAIGRTNDAILYGGRVTLWVRADDRELAEVGPRVPAGASPAFGAPFASIFERAGKDFYKIDPLLFSPAEVVFHNLKTGRTLAFGRTEPEVLRASFFSPS
jgi:methenyltetrahydromethanopterin cyclohydrolase